MNQTMQILCNVPHVIPHTNTSISTRAALQYTILVLVYPANPTTLGRPSRPPPNRVIPPHRIRVDYLGVPGAIKQPGSFAGKVLEILFVGTTFGRAGCV